MLIAQCFVLSAYLLNSLLEQDQANDSLFYYVIEYGLQPCSLCIQAMVINPHRNRYIRARSHMYH